MAIPPVPNVDSPIKFISSEHFVGCNFYHNSSVIWRGVDFGIFTKATTTMLGPEFATNFLDRFQGLKSLIPHNGLKDEFIARLKSPQGVEFGELLLEAILAVETSTFFTMHNLHTVSYATVDKCGQYTHLVWSCSIAKIPR